jgi:hypothetical protein
MKHAEKENIENLRERLYKLRQALKPPERCKTPTQPIKSINTSRSPSRNVSPNKPFNNYTPIMKSSASKASEISVNSSVNSSYILKTVSSRRSDKSTDKSTKSSVNEIRDESEEIKKILAVEIENKIELLGKLENSVEKLMYLIAIKKQERRTEVDRNVFLYNYVIKHNNNKADLDVLNAEIENFKTRLEKLKDETFEIRSNEEGIKMEIDKFNSLIKEVRNDNTVMKVRKIPLNFSLRIRSLNRV